MFAAVDLGSNSFRLHVARIQGQRMHIVHTDRVPVRLGGGLDEQGCLTPTAIQAGLAALGRFSGILSSYPLHGVRVVGTQALRRAVNAGEFLSRAQQVMAYPIDIISGDEEGRLIYLGVAHGSREDFSRRLVVDIGGGSTEVAVGQHLRMEDVESFAIGTVPVNKNFFADGSITAVGFDNAVEASRRIFATQSERFAAHQWRTAYGSSGTVRAIRQLILRNHLADGPITQRALRLLQEQLIACGRVDRITLAGLKPDRMDMICGGIALLRGLMEAFDIAELVPTPAGLRIGVLWDLHLNAGPCDRRAESIAAFAQRFHASNRQGREAADLACWVAALLFDELEPSQTKWLEKLDWAARLHAIGMGISRRNYHKHGASLIENSSLDGLTDIEQRHVSELVLSQKGSLKKLRHRIDDTDFVRCVLALRLALLLLRAEALGTVPVLRARLKKGIRIQFKKAVFQDYPALKAGLDREQRWWQQAGVSYKVREL
jgi:exopolyphosphatase/guanosine-5'-triphosphate,3'-diphosphate pyrophosphatase